MNPDETNDGRRASPRHAFRNLPFSGWWPLLAGALMGLALRLVFSGRPGHPYAAMMATFIYLSPAIVGAVTVYVAERQERRSWKYYIAAPFLANVIYVLGTLLIMIEGLVCAVVIVPLFAALGAVGGVLMGAVCRLTHWPRQALYGFAALPLLLGAVEGSAPLPQRTGSVERTVTVQAAPAEVWRQILDTGDIRPHEVDRAWVFRIGVPVPLQGATQQTAEGPVRRVRMAKDIHFDQVITHRQERRYLRWTYRFHEDSFPPYALDEHVVIGGHYFDILDTSYTLEPAGGHTKLTVRMTYRLSTQFNWYAEPVARLLLANLGEVNLKYYRHRSESGR